MLSVFLLCAAPSLAKHHAAAHLMHQRQHQAAAEMWGQAIQALPDQSEL